MVDSEYPIGTRIRNLRQKGENAGKKGTIIDDDGDYVYIEYDDGSSGKSDDPSQYYQVIGHANENSARSGSNTPMKGIVQFVKNALLSSDEKLLRKFALKTECGDYTQAAKDIVINKLCRDNEAELVTAATAYEAELRADAE